MAIRKANINDLNRITEIYNQSIEKGMNAFLELVTYEEMKKSYESRDLKEHPYIVYEEGDEIIGWGSISPFRKDREAYLKTKEVSFYLDHRHLGKGIGSKLIEHVIENRNLYNFDNLFAVLLASNKASIALLKKYDFKLWGYMPNVIDFKSHKDSGIIYGRNFELF